ncbi:MAG: hypothetical protein GX916_00880 [Clostridiales bacterium]|nr:hypothetical protein [Clostridiales bacterium]
MLKKEMYTMFKRGEVKPAGWLKRQLRIQADGLAGNLDKVWPDVRDSKWIGGDREGWERVPYWLDGFIPLAWLLDDADMKQRAKAYMDAIIAGQEEDGWICPCTREERRGYDLWGGILIAKVLAMYADLADSAEAAEALYKLLHNMWVFTRHHTLHNWAMMRWFEALIPIFWMYQRQPEDWLLSLARRLKQQGFDYDGLFAPFRGQTPQRLWTYETHVVNLSMAIKQGALMSLLDGGDADEFADRMLGELLHHHGMPVGHFAGDECLAGDKPNRGTELCGIVEAMYAYEWLLSISGNPKWGDALEKLAYNALPATITEDMWAHQYDQQTNQVRCERLPEGHVIFGTNGPESHLFGLEPNFGCCTANFGQGWPKFAMSLFMKSEKGLVSTALAPGSVTTDVNGVRVSIALDTDYPFSDTLRYTVDTASPAAFELMIRIPSGMRSASVNGAPAAPGAFFKIEKTWSGTETIEVALEPDLRIEPRPRDMGVLWRGQVLYAVEIGEQWTKKEYTAQDVERKFPYCDYEVSPLTPWNYAFSGQQAFTFKQNAIGAYPFGKAPAPAEITANLVPVPWEEEHGVCTAEPASRVPSGTIKKVRMIPYGCARLRMTEMPVLE